MKIDYIEYGLAYRLPDGTVLLNKELTKSPKALREILKHESSHDPTPYPTLKDLLLDLEPPHIEVIKFLITHPKTWTQILPFRIYKGYFAYDTGAILLYSLFIGLYFLFSAL